MVRRLRRERIEMHEEIDLVRKELREVRKELWETTQLLRHPNPRGL